LSAVPRQLSASGGQLSASGGQLSANGGQLSASGGICPRAADICPGTADIVLRQNFLADFLADKKFGGHVCDIFGGQLSALGGQLVRGGQLSADCPPTL